MKAFKTFCLLLAMFVVPIVRAGAPPETINLHQRDGNIITAAFTEFNRIEFSGDNLQFVGRNEPVRVKLGTIRKITFGEPHEAFGVPVSFAATGNGTGTLTAFVLETNQALLSGGEVEAGNTVVFRAEPAQGSKIRGWYINEVYKETAATEQRVVLDKELHAEGLYVEVEFVKETGIESGERNLLNVYVQGREIHIESTCELKRAELLDMGGRLLRTQNSAQGAHQMLLHAGNVASGVYILKVRSTEREETRKVIIR